MLCVKDSSIKIKTSSFILILSIGLVIASFTQTAYCTDNHCADAFAIYISGGLGFYLSPAGLTWLANPLLIISWATFNSKHRLSFIMSLLSSIASISFLAFNKIIDNSIGSYDRIISYKLGYWLWMAGSLVMFMGNITLYIQTQNVITTPVICE